MAYCRWSSMNWRCDLYCYEHVGGYWIVHVAGNRVVGDIPPEPSWELLRPESSEADRAKFWDMHKAVMVFLETAEREPITLPHVGETFTADSPAAMAEKLLELRAVGYRFPDDVLTELAEEQSELDSAHDRTRPH